MSYSFFEGEVPKVIVHGDCDGERQKRTAVFAAHLLSPGVDSPADLEPRNFKDVEVVVAPGTSADHVAQIMGLAGVEYAKSH